MIRQRSLDTLQPQQGGHHERSVLLQNLAALITALPKSNIIRVAVDGVDGAGKTYFADELASAVHSHDRAVIRASIDGFHNPRVVRYKRGRNNPTGFYLDSYDYDAFRRYLIDPLSPGGSARYRIAAFDHVTDSPVSVAEQHALPEAVLIVDGIFLHRPELRGYWDFSVFLQVSFDVSVPRVIKRDVDSDSAALATILHARYVEGQKHYLRECRPETYATMTIDNNDLSKPKIIAMTAQNV